MPDGRSVKVTVDIVSGSKKGADDARKAVSDLDEEVRRVNAETTRQAKYQEKLRQEAQRQSVRAMEAEIRRLEREDKAAAKRAADSFIASFKEREKAMKATGSGGSGFKDSFLGFTAAGAIAKLTGLFEEGASAILDYSSRLEQARIGFTTMTGSAQLAEDHLKALQEFARTTPFQFDQLVLASQQLQGIGFRAQEVVPLLTDVGNALSAAGRMDELPNAIKALGDIKSKGKLAGQEINQLANAGIPIRQVLAKDLKVSTDQVVELGEKGKISADQVFAALHRMSTENFGGAMERQSHTFSGAMSNLSDAVNIASAQMFKPIYDEISRFADKVSKSLGDQQEALKGEGVSFGFAIGEAIGDGVERSKIADPSWWAQVLAIAKPVTDFGVKLGQGIVKGYTDAADPLQQQIDALNQQSQALLDKVAEFKKQKERYNELITGTFSADQKASFERAAKEAELLVKTVDDLTTQIAFFGQNTEVAATKQKLLAGGVVDFNSSLAKNAIALATQLDKLKATAKAADEYNQKLKSTTDELKQMQDKASFEIKFPNATDLDKFDWWVKTQAANFKELKEQIDNTRSSLQTAASIAEIREGATALKKAFEDVDDKILDLKGRKSNAFTDSALDFAKSLKLKGMFSDEFGVDRTQEQFAQKMEGFIETYRTLLKTLGNDQGAPAALGKVRDSIKNFLLSFNVDANTHIFGDKDEIDQVINRFLALSDAIDTAADKEKLKTYTDTVDELTLKLDQDSKATETNRIQKLLLTDAYKGLTDEQKANLVSLAKTVDANEEAAKAAKKYEEEQRKAFEKTTDFFRDKLDKLMGGGFKSLWHSILDDFKKIFIDKAARMLAEMFTGAGPANPTASTGGVSMGGSLRGILQNIFGSRVSTTVSSGVAPLGGADPHNPWILHFNNAPSFPIPHAHGPSADDGGDQTPEEILTGASSVPKSGGLLGKVLGVAGKFAPLIGIAGMGIGLLGKLFHRDDAIKKLRDAARNVYGIDIKDKSVLQQLKAIGEGSFGKGQAGAHAVEVVSSEDGRQLIQNYAQGTGQSTLQLDRANYADPTWKGNDFTGRFNGFRALGGQSRAAIFTQTPSSGFVASATGASGGSATPFVDRTLMAAFAESNYQVAEQLARLNVMPPGPLVRMGLEQDPDAAADAYDAAFSNNGAIRQDQYSRLTGQAN